MSVPQRILRIADRSLPSSNGSVKHWQKMYAINYAKFYSRSYHL
jgi:hypothetical protein